MVAHLEQTCLQALFIRAQKIQSRWIQLETGLGCKCEKHNASHKVWKVEENKKKQQLTPSSSWKVDISDLEQMVVYVPKCRYSAYSLIGIRKEVAFSWDCRWIA